MQKLPRFVLIVLLIAPSPLAADGELDSTFGMGGIVITDFSGGDDHAFNLALQSDGKIVAAGGTTTGFALARYNSDGSLDTSFGSGGKVTTVFSSGATAVALQSDGKILAAGGSFAAGGSLLVRYNSDGSLDTSFGSQGKVGQMGFWGFSVSLVLQPDGKIVIAGQMLSSSDFALIRYNSDGSLDTSFGSAGIVTTDFSGDDDEVYALALQPDGKIVAVGRTTGRTTSAQSFFALARYNSDGSLDTTFGSGGKVTTSFFSNDFSFAETVAIQPDGKIVAGGGGFVIETQAELARYNSDGSLDQTFGAGGKLIDYGFGEARSLALQSDGKIVVASYPYIGDLALTRYKNDGSVDTTFGVGGYVTDDAPWNIALQPDGKIVAAGQTLVDFRLARYDNHALRRPRGQITSS